MVASSYKGDRPKLRSEHLYQVLNYLEHLKPGPPTTGMLLYAQSGSALSLDLTLGGHRLQIRSLDLNQPWDGIHRDLLELVA